MIKRVKGNELNPKEALVLKCFPVDEPISIKELAKSAFPRRGISAGKQGNWWVRNCMRKLTKMRLAKKIGRGLYKRTAKAA